MCSHAQPVARGTHAPPLFLYFQCVPVAPFDYPDFSKSNDLMCFEITCDNCKCNCCLCKLVKEMCVCLHFFYIVFECLKPKRQKKFNFLIAYGQVSQKLIIFAYFNILKKSYKYYFFTCIF
jgi:hypothetical protein